MKNKKILIITALLTIFLRLGASPFVPITPDFTSKKFYNDFYYFHDENRLISYDSVSLPSFAVNFIKEDGKIPYINYQHKNLWVKFGLENQSNHTKNLFINCKFTLIDTVILYQNISGTLYTDTVGTGLPFNTRKIKEITPVFEIELLPQEKRDIFIKIINHNTTSPLSISVSTKSQYYLEKSYAEFAHGIFYGMLIIIILINLFFFINLKNHVYLYYSLYVIAFTFFFLVQDGIAFKYIWPQYIWLAKQSTQIFVLLTIIFILLFSKTALKSSFYFPTLNKFLNISIFANLILIIVNFASKNPLNEILNVFAILSAIPILLLNVQILRIKKLPLSYYYLISFFFLYIGVISYVLRNFGFVDFETGTIILEICVVIQLLILSFGLIAMYQSILKESNQSVVDNLKQLNNIKDQLNAKLEQQVENRTKEIDKKNIELMLANRQLGAERDLFELQRNLIANQKQQTTDSITYAKRIQSTLMPSFEILKKIFPNSFIIDIPKDIVSGDFYWVVQYGNYKLAAVADCTGHGVPGAFMSIIGITYLKEIIRNSSELKPNEILFQLRNKIINSFRTAETDIELKDGMDISLISINNDATKLEFAGAYNSVYIVRDNELITLKADRMPISTHEKEEEAFNLLEYDLQSGDMIYLLSDGYTDQFGWRTGKKFKHTQLKELLLDINEMPEEVKHVVIRNAFKNWKGDLEQVDDIMILGIKI